MNKERITRAALSAVVAVSLIVVVPGLIERVRAEGASRQVELVMDLGQVELLAWSQGYRTEEVLAELAWAGLGAVTWDEANLDRLSRSGHLAVYEGRELARLAAAGVLTAPEMVGLAAEGFFKSGWTYAFTDDSETAAWLRQAACDNLAADTFRIEQRGRLTVLEVRFMNEVASFMGLGFFRPDMERSGAAAAGLRVVPRPAATSSGREALERKIASLEEAVSELGLEVSTVIFAGGEILGYPDGVDATLEMLHALDAPVGVIEHTRQSGNLNQLGVNELAAASGYRVVRVYSVPDVRVWAPGELVWEVVRAVKDRGLRVVFLRPYLVVPEHLVEVVPVGPGGVSLYDPPPGRSLDYTPLLALNVNYLRQMAERLTAEGFALGEPVPMDGPAPLGPWRVVLLALGPAAGLGLLWLDLRPRSRRWLRAGPLLFVTAAAVVALLAFGGHVGTAQQVAAAMAAFAFPSLGLAWLARMWALAAGPSGTRGGGVTPEGPAGVSDGARHPLPTAALIVRDVAVPTALAVVGGVLTAAILGDLRFMLEFDHFLAAELTYLVIPGAALVYWLRYRFPDETQPVAWPSSIAKVAALDMRVGHAAAVLGAAFLFYVALEIQARHPLEAFLHVSPRFTEVLAGYPALIVGSWLAHTASRSDQRGACLGGAVLVASLGLASIVRSFGHVRTGLMVSLLGVGHGLWTGALVGLLVLAAVKSTLRLCGLRPARRGGEAGPRVGKGGLR